jgi:hypothetical protein
VARRCEPATVDEFSLADRRERKRGAEVGTTQLQDTTTVDS